MDVPRDTWVTLPTHDGGWVRFIWSIAAPVPESQEEES